MAEKLNWHMMPMVTEDMLKAGHTGGEGGQWELCVTCDQIDGTLLFTGTDVGGMFRSTDGGERWEPCNIGLDCRGASYICIDPVDKRHIVAVGCNSGANKYNGIYVSINGGDVWEHTLDGYFASYRDFRDQVAMDPASYDADFGGCKTVYWSRVCETDSKNSWGEHRPHSGLFKSTDGGYSWVEIAEGLGDAIVKVHPTDSCVYVAHSTGFFKSTDGGKTFKCTFGTDDGTVDGVNGLDVVKSLPDTVFINTKDGIYRSDDCGETWKYIAGDGFPCGEENHPSWLKVSNADPQRMLVCKMSEDYQKCGFVSHDGGKTWAQAVKLNKLNFLPPNNRQLVFSWHPTDPDIVWTLGGDFTCRSTDGGKTFDWYHNGNLGIMVGGHIHFNVSDPDLFYFASQDYDGCVTYNGGKTWKYVNMYGATWGGFCYGGYAIDADTYVCGRRASWSGPSEIYVTHDAGKTVDHTGIFYDGLPPASGDPKHKPVAFAGSKRTADKGFTWSPMDNCTGVTDHDTVTGKLIGISKSKVVESSDHGITWEDVADCGVDLIDVTYDHENGYYFAVACDILFRIKDGAVENITQNVPVNKMGERKIKAVALDKRYPNVIYIAGGGNAYMNDSAVMRSTDSGETWQVLTRNTRNSIITDGYGLGWEANTIAVRPDTGVLYVPGSCFGFATVDAYSKD